MIAFELELRFPAGVMVSGYSAGSDGLHGETARDRDGNPVVPATAIRGALREALEAVLRGAGKGACDGGNGVAPKAPDPVSPGAIEAAPEDPPCTLGEGGQRCLACRLFGTRRKNIDKEERAFSALVLGNAAFEGDSAGWIRRPGVALDRRLWAAADDRLFLQRTAGGGGERVFRARGRLIDDSMLGCLKAAVEATSHIGAGKSRGLAQVSVRLVVPPKDARERAAVSLPPGDEVRVRLTLESPASFGEAVNDENSYDTRRYIPGSAWRGAIGFGLSETLSRPNEDEAFQELVSEDKGALFGFLYPVDDEQDAPSGPLPITAVWCKRHEREHGIEDTLLDRIAAHRVTELEDAETVRAKSLHVCAKCSANMRGAKGDRRLSGGLPLRAVTRAATDRRLRSARDEALFTQVLIESRVRFEGRIRGIGADSGVRARLEQALSGALSVGRGGSAGWGQVAVRVLPPWNMKPIRERKRDFDRALEDRFKQVRDGFGMDLVGRLVPITLLAPLIPEQMDEDGAGDLTKATGASRCYLSARRFTREGGWDQRKGKMTPAVATAAGGVFVLEFPTKEAADAAIQKLEDLERRGVGERRYQGYGEVVCFDPFILQRRFS